MKKAFKCPDPIAAELVKKQLRTTSVGHRVHYLLSTPSTNTIAQELARGGAPEGTVVIKDYQTHGRAPLGAEVAVSSGGGSAFFSYLATLFKTRTGISGNPCILSSRCSRNQP